MRKGVWLGVPAVELGAGVVSLLESSLLSWQAYAKLALHEGFPRRPFPSVALRGAVAYVTGTSQVRLTTLALDVIASKTFGVGGTFRVEPYVAWSFLRIQADSGLIDATPSCDAFRVRTSPPGQASASIAPRLSADRTTTASLISPFLGSQPSGASACLRVRS